MFHPQLPSKGYWICYASIMFSIEYDIYIRLRLPLATLFSPFYAGLIQWWYVSSLGKCTDLVGRIYYSIGRNGRHGFPDKEDRGRVMSLLGGL